jgi:hypothetical protein
LDLDTHRGRGRRRAGAHLAQRPALAPSGRAAKRGSELRQQAETRAEEADERRAAAEQMAQRAEADRREAELTTQRANELDPDVDVEKEEQART